MEIKKKTLALNLPSTKLKNIRRAILSPFIKLTTRTGKQNLKETFPKIMKLLDKNFKVYCSTSESYIEVKNGKIYYHFENWRTPESGSWLIFADDNKIPIENYNVDYYYDEDTGERKWRFTDWKHLKLL